MADLCTIEDVRQYLGVEGSLHDELLTRLIDVCSAEIEAHLGQPVLASTGNVTHRFSGSNTLYELLPYFPIVSVGALTYQTSVGAEPVVVDTDTYEAVRGRLVATSTLWGGYEYTLTLTVGHTTVPKDVAQVCIEMVALRAKDSFDTKIGAARLGKKSEGKSVAGSSSTTVFERPDWERRLAPYRVVTI